MPCEKKEVSPRICVSSSQKILHHLSIQDLPQGTIICLPGSQRASPRCSSPRLCTCNKEYCKPDACLKNIQEAVKIRDRQCQEQQQPTASCVQTCKGLGRVTMDDIPCCQEMLRKLAQEALAYDSDFPELEKRVSIQERQDRTSGSSSHCCVGRRSPLLQAQHVSNTNSPSCSMKMRLVTKPQSHSCAMLLPESKIKSCCNNLDCVLSTELLEPTMRQSCTTFIGCQGGLVTPRICTAPTPCNEPCSSIASNSCQRFFGRLSRKKNSSVNKIDVKEKKNKKMPDLFSGVCSHTDCAVNTCPCRFPPAYSQYYECTGQISGNCQCGKN